MTKGRRRSIARINGLPRTCTACEPLEERRMLTGDLDLPWPADQMDLHATLPSDPVLPGGVLTGPQVSADGQGNYVVVWKRGADGNWRLQVDTWNDAPME